RVRRASLGIGAQNLRLPRRYVRYFDLPIETAVRVIEIANGSPADRAGVEAGDILIRFGEHDVDGIDALHRILGADRIGRDASVDVLRRDRRLALSLTPAEL
ncbi:MAG TPA: PDZ domain-containing protein, partial [Tahibacter sp.]|nr:PDZ domain-containing protein [Tahibacter sp.]